MIFPIKKSIYNDHIIFIIYLWGTDSYFIHKKIQISDVELMNAAYGSSGSFISRVRSKSIWHNTYTGRRLNIRSKSTAIHIPVHKFDLNYSYSISHFSRLPEAVAKEIINRMSNKVMYASIKFDPVINGFNLNEVKIQFHIYERC